MSTYPIKRHLTMVANQNPEEVVKQSRSSERSSEQTRTQAAAQANIPGSLEASSSSASASPLSVASKIPMPAVFDRIRAIVCRIQSAEGFCSAFFIHPNTVLTLCSYIPAAQSGQPDFSSVKVTRVYEKRTQEFSLQPMKLLNPDNAKALDLFMFNTNKAIEASAILPPIPQEFSLREGVTIYFAGFTPGTFTPHFYKGYIDSTKETKQGVVSFSIDGTFMPGNIGGPIVLQNKGKLYLAGIVNVDTIPFSEQRILMNTRQVAMDFNAQEASSSSVATHPEFEAFKASIFSIMPDVFPRVTMRGLDIRAARLLTQRQIIPIPPRKMPTMDAKDMIRASLKDASNNKLFDYMEIRYGKNGGASPRGIQIGTNTRPAQYRTFRISPNPHKTSDYNTKKKEKDFYKTAAKAFKEAAYIENSDGETELKWPDNFTFETKHHTFTATRETGK